MRSMSMLFCHASYEWWDVSSVEFCLCLESLRTGATSGAANKEEPWAVSPQLFGPGES